MSERSDELDVAAEMQEQANVDALARVRLQLTQTHPDFDGVHCIEADCGVELPGVRIAYKRIRCTTCETKKEQQAKLRRRA
jgi:hypothetical protein